MSLHRVVVTGLAALTPIGNDLSTSWQALLAGTSGIGPITRFDTTDFATHIAGEVKNFEESPHVDKKSARRMDRFTLYAVHTAMEAMLDAGLPLGVKNDRMGAIIGVGLGGLETIEHYHARMLEGGPKKLSPFFIPILIANMAAGQVSMFSGARGPNMCTTSACASGLHSVHTAFTDLRLGRADIMIAGGSESTITPLAVGGFNALKALSTRNDDPTHASRPFDAERDGFVIGEGSGILILETLENATKRGARIYAEIVGVGSSGDAYHMTAPDENGEGAALAMRAALREAGVAPEDIDHVNAHGTSTQLNDATETKALKKVFGEHAYKLAITANKSMIGHLLGAAGGVESVFTCKTLQEGVIPQTINLTNPDPGCDLDYVTEGVRRQAVRYGLCNSFGFGGTNCSVLFKALQE